MRQLEFLEVMKLLAGYKLPVAKAGLAKTAEQALIIAKQIGFPVVLKVESPDIAHKSDVKGVVMGIMSKALLVEAYNRILKDVRKAAPKARIDGMIVQKMETGKEVIVGMKRDPQFGPVLLFGLGGIFVEVLKDFSLRITPINRKEALDMLHEIRGSQLLKGVRGERPVKLNALADMLLKVSKLAMANKQIAEFDLNPVIANEKCATIVDARVIVDE